MESRSKGRKRSRIHLRFASAIAVLMLCVLLAQMYGKLFRPNGNDLFSYLQSARALMQGNSPYETGSPFPYIYPPFLAFILIPLTSLPLWLSGLLWFLFNATAYIFALKILLDMLFKAWGTALDPRAWIVVTAVSILAFDVIQNHMLNGQVNFVVLALTVLFFKALSQGKNAGAALLLSLAVVIKLVPLIFLVYLLVRRKVRALVYAIGLTILVMLLPLPLVGGKIFSFYHTYLHQFLLSRVGLSGEWGPGTGGFSLRSLLDPLFSSADSRFSGLVLASVLVLMPIICLELTRRTDKDQEKELWVFCLYLIATLLISPMSETHHLVLFIPALALGSVAIVCRAEYVSFGRIFLYVAAFVFLLAGKMLDSSPLYFLSLVMGYCGTIAMCLAGAPKAGSFLQTTKSTGIHGEEGS